MDAAEAIRLAGAFQSNEIEIRSRGRAGSARGDDQVAGLGEAVLALVVDDLADQRLAPAAAATGLAVAADLAAGGGAGAHHPSDGSIGDGLAVTDEHSAILRGS